MPLKAPDGSSPEEIYLPGTPQMVWVVGSWHAMVPSSSCYDLV